jgi:hypothetical protein
MAQVKLNQAQRDLLFPRQEEFVHPHRDSVRAAHVGSGAPRYPHANRRPVLLPPTVSLPSVPQHSPSYPPAAPAHLPPQPVGDGGGGGGRQYQPGAASAAAPLFERRARDEARAEQQLLALLEENAGLRRDLHDANRLLENAVREHNSAQYINDDLEHRLEHEAKARIKLEEQIAKERADAAAAAAEAKRVAAEAARTIEEQARLRARAEEGLRRVEKELYRMHQVRPPCVITTCRLRRWVLCLTC